MSNSQADGQDRFGRAHWFRPEELDDAQRLVYESITTGPRNNGQRSSPLTDEQGRLGGPFNAMLYSARVGNALQQLGAAVRYETELGAAAREIAILEVARVNRCDTEWLGHARIATAAGVSEAQLEVLLTGNAPEDLGATELAVRELALILLRDGDLDDANFSRTVAALGEKAVMEVIVLVGYYGLLAMSMRVWRNPLPAGAEPVFTS